MKRFAWVLGLLAIIACSSLPYSDDNGFLVSAQADSPEFPVYINGHLCTDMEGGVGLCSKRIKSDEGITFRFDPQPYSYLLTVTCTTGVPVMPSATVPAGQPFSFEIPKEAIGAFKSFTCIGEISPQDRPDAVSAKWEVRFKVVDLNYAAREQAFLLKKGKKNYLVLGAHARTAWVFDGKWSKHSQETIVELQGDPEKAKAYSESFAMRFNYFHMGDSDGGVSLD